MNIGHLVATLGVNTAGLALAQQNMRQFETRMNASVKRINASLATASTAMKKFGRGMTMYVTAPLALIGGAAFKMHMDFESSMAKIVGLVGVAREQVDQWSKDILKMAPRLGKSPQELADALFFVTSAGLRGAEAMDVLEMSAKASAGGLGETKIVADLVTSAMNAYGSAVLNAEQATDILVATVREGKAEADALTASMGMVLPIASNMGVAFHEVGAAIAAMSRTGTKAATASMQLRQILASLLKPTQQSAELLEAMGTSSEQVAAGFKAMRTSASYFRKVIREEGLLVALMEIKELSAEFGEEAMSKVFPNIRALSGVLDLLGENLEGTIAIFKRMGITTDSLNKLFEVTADTAKFKFNQSIVTIKTSLTILGKTVSEAFLPILKILAEKVQKLTDWFTSLSDAQRQQVVRIAGIIAVIGPLSIVLGVLVSGLRRLITIGYMAVKMFHALNIAMAANPAMAIAAGIAILVTVIIAFTKKKKEATEAQLAFNKALEEEGLLMGDLRSITARISVLETLNKRQVEDLVRTIESQIQLEEDRTAKLLVEAKTRVHIEEEAIKAQELWQRYSVKKWKLTEEEKALFARVAAAGTTKIFQEENLKRIDDLSAYLLLAKLKLLKFKDDTDEIVAGIAKSWLEIIKERRAEVPSRIAGIGRFPTPPGEKLAKQAKLIADAWFEAAEAGRLYDTTMNVALLNMEGVMDRNVKKADELASAWNRMIEVSLILSDSLQRFAEQGLSVVKEGIAKMVAGTGSMRDLLSEILKTFGIFLQEMGTAIMAYGLAMEAFKKAFINPLVAIAAGLALIVAGGIIRNLASKGPVEMAEGGIVTKPILAILGEKGPEAVIPLNKQAMGGDIYITLEPAFSNEDLYYRVKEVDRKHSNSF